MKLTEYLKLLQVRPTVWAKREGLPFATVWRLWKGKGVPVLHTMRAIERATKGAVKPEDWY